METKHTPGPWKIGLNPGPMVYTLDGVSQIADARGLAVTKDESNANARLIAAAPELLKALKFLTDASETEPEMAIYRAHIAQARAAIAKAT